MIEDQYSVLKLIQNIAITARISWTLIGRQQQWFLGACLPIVDVPVHIVMGMPMTVGMGMPMALTMGTKNHIIDIAYGLHYGHARLAQQIT